MRFMMLVKGDADYEAGTPIEPALIEAIGRLAEEGLRNGTLVEQGGLLPSAAGARVKVEGGTVRVIDGPFTEARELVGGFAVIEAASKAEAIEMGAAFMRLHADILGPSYVGELEIRQMFEAPPCTTA